jgi:hypothetical protein
MDKVSALRNRARAGRLLWLLSPWMLAAVILFTLSGLRSSWMRMKA